MSKIKIVKFIIGACAGYIGAKMIWRGRKARSAEPSPAPVREG
ncbi:MAG: hypothetical protein NT062_10940 [Proteobacteria bacterium]|nr:hypothetical protein [Pseudomonadota bacterium]